MKSYELRTGAYINESGQKIDFDYYTDIPIVKKVSFVNSVVNTVVGDNYISILRDLIFDFRLVDMFTDIDVSEIADSPNSLTRIEEFLDSGIADIVKASINQNVLDELNKSVDDSIQYKTGIHRSELMTALTSLVNSLDNTVNNLNSEDMMEIAKKLNTVSDTLTTDNIMQSYVNSNMFGKTIDEIKEQRDKENHMIEEVNKLASSGVPIEEIEAAIKKVEGD